MKPRSKVEKQFVELTNSLPPYEGADKVIEWAKEKVFKPVSYYWQHRGNNREIWCQCCGHREPCDSWLVMSISGYTCPECGKETKVRRLEKRTCVNESRYVTVFDVVNDIQVMRCFEVSRCNGGCAKTDYSMSELYQCWELESGRELITTRGYSRGHNFLHWNYGRPYSIGRHRESANGYYYYEDVYHPEENFIYPKMRIAKSLRRSGINKGLVDMTLKCKIELRQVLSLLREEPYSETLLKTGYRRLFLYLAGHKKNFSAYRHAVNICHRNGYRINDPGIWVDYMDNLMELGLDTHNAHYVCPANLKVEHGRMMARCIRKRAKDEFRKKIGDISKDDKVYQQMRSQFKGLEFRSNDFTVVFIKSVDEVFWEGKILGHCVFANGYYKNKDSLLLSARDNETNTPIETIEIDLPRLRILQCRGYHNQPSKYHDQILSLVEQHLPDIRKAAQIRREVI